MSKYHVYYHWVLVILKGIVMIPIYPILILSIVCRNYIKSLQEKEIHRLAITNNIASLREYIEQGKDINIRNFEGETALHLSISKGSYDFVEILVDAGADIEQKSKDNSTPLYLAALFDRHKIYNLLIQKGASIDIFTGVLRNELETVRELLTRCKNINSQNKSFRPLLHLAIMKGHYDLTKLLIESGANINAVENLTTPLNLAISHGNLSIVKLLINNGAKINPQTDFNHPLHEAVANDKLEIVKFLLSQGAHIDARNRFPEGHTPLHLAVFSGNTEITLLLLENGANPHIKNWLGGFTPVTLAQQINSDTLEILLQYTEDCE